VFPVREFTKTEGVRRPIYELPWRTEPKALGLDLSYHLVYGVGAAAVFEALD
jgi:hypothetical protein